MNGEFGIFDVTAQDQANQELRRAAYDWATLELHKKQKQDDRFNDPMMAYKLRQELAQGW